MRKRPARQAAMAGPWMADEFTTAAGAPLGPTRVAEPGPGVWNVTDTENKLSINASGALVIASGRSPAVWGDPGMYLSEPFGKCPGLAMYLKMVHPTSGQFRIGNNDTPSSYPFQGYLSWGAPVSPFVAGTVYEWMKVYRGRYGTMTFVKGGVYTDWELYAVTASYGSGSEEAKGTLFFGVTGYDAVNAVVHEVRQFVLGGSWDNDGQLDKASLYAATTTDGQTFEAPGGDAYIEHTVVHQVGVTQDFEFRRTDADNCFIFRMEQATGYMRLLKREGGAEIQLVQKAVTQTPGATYRISIKLRGSRIDTGEMGLGGTNTFNQTASGVRVSHAGADLIVWPLTGWDLTQRRSQYRVRSVYYVGDSKTANGDVGYYHYFLSLTTGARRWPSMTAGGGRSTATLQTLIDAELAARTAIPDVVLYNMGANDTTFDAAWKNSTAYIVDAIHAKWPNAPVYVVTAWTRANGLAKAQDLYNRVEELMATRPWLHHGIDERVLLENGDDGVTYTADGTHPTTAGHQREAAAWKALLGW